MKPGVLLAVTEEEDGSRPALETREFCRKEAPWALEWRPGLTRRAEGPPLMCEVPVVVSVVDIEEEEVVTEVGGAVSMRSLSQGGLRNCLPGGRLDSKS